MTSANHEIFTQERKQDSFDTDNLKFELKGRSIRGGAATILGQALRFIIQIGTTTILARLLVPADFGLIAMVTSVTGFAAMFKDLGLSMATVQKAKINHDQISTLFWINVAVSGIIAILIVAAAPIIAWFYRESRLIPVTIALSIVFLLGGLTIQHQALLQRQMRFTALASIQVISMLAGAVAAIGAAAIGMDYWALVIMQVVSALVIALGVWLAIDWRPGRPARHAGVRGMLVFGGNITGFNIINYFTRNLDNILIGWARGASELGFYSKAYGLLMLPVQQINSPVSAVAIPALSILQNRPDRYRSFYRKGIELLAFLGMPVVVFLYVAAEEAVLLVLGNQWAATVPLFRALGPAAFMATTNVATGWVFVTTGRVSQQLRWGIFASTVLCLFIVAGLRWGAFGVALGVSGSRVLMKVPGLWYCYRGTVVKLIDFWWAVWRPALASIGAGFLIYPLKHPLYNVFPSVMAEFASLMVIYGIVYLMIFAVLPGGMERIKEIFSMLRDLKKPKKEVATHSGVATD